MIAVALRTFVGACLAFGADAGLCSWEDALQSVRPHVLQRERATAVDVAARALGGSVARTGAVAYENGALVKDLVAAGKTMHVYAVWQKRAYTVCFHRNYGASATADSVYVNGEIVKDIVGSGQTLHLYGAWGKKTK